MIEVMLSTNRWVATSVSLAVMSRPTEIRCVPSTENDGVEHPVVVRAHEQDLLRRSWRRWPGRVLSAQPKAILVPSGDQLAP